VPEDDEECMGLPTFLSAEQQGDIIHNYWYPEVPEMITPYELANLRNIIAKDTLAYFVVLARNETDVVKAVQFATSHNIGISVFSTGHEFNDRNAGSGNNSLLIRTTCLRTVQFDLQEENRFDHPDGFVRLGSGMTWGTSKFGATGVHELARDNGRVVVSGHAGNVGIVGWSLGGGHGQLVGTYGMGVDQVLEVEMVIADGSMVVANAEGTLVTSEGGLTEHTDNADLFWALRGGGAGTWGIITAMTIKVHEPRDSCETGCYSQWLMVWESNFNDDDGKMMEDVIAAYLTWVATSSKYWSSYAAPSAGEDGKYFFLPL
jgi:FAD/FMN-containing dehydrogenase